MNDAARARAALELAEARHHGPVDGMYAVEVLLAAGFSITHPECPDDP